MQQKPFLIFHYHFNGKTYVEGYPLNDRPFKEVLAGLPTSIRWGIVEAPSRTQARKVAYCRWVSPDGVGFNKLALSPIYERYCEAQT